MQNKTKDTGNSVLVSPLAGRWFPADADELRRSIDALLPVPRPAPVADVCAVLVPHAGYVYSGSVAAAVYARLDPQAYDRVVIFAPSHSVPMENRVSVPDATALQTPLGQVEVDTEFVAALRTSPLVIHDPRAHLREHSDQIQIPLLQRVFGSRFRVVSVVFGQLDPAACREIADRVRPLLDARTLLVVSSDFTHYGPNYGYVPFTGDVSRRIEALDRRIFERIAARDARGFWRAMGETRATVCGCVPIGALLELLPANAQVIEVAYDTSGRQLGDSENSVSYFGALVTGRWRGA